jgi:chemotaxis protein histidine kinase CheA
MKSAATQPDDVEEMIHRFHWFAGAGGTCGYPTISKLGRACERICLSVKKHETTPDTRMISAWQTLLDRLKAEVESAESNKC